MAIRNIITVGDDILTKRCRMVENFDKRLHILLDDMKDTLVKANGVGLAAPQVGILKRVVIVDVGDGLIEMVNPVIIDQSGEQTELEGCLSCPGKAGITVRPMNVTVKAFDRNGKEFTVKGDGLKARAFCHELDHLEGILFIDKAIRVVDMDEFDEDDCMD